MQVSATTSEEHSVTTGEPPVRVAVVDDDGRLVKALSLLFAEEPSLRFVGGASSVADGIELVARYQPDVVLVDVRMPAGGGVAVVSQARRVAPHTVVLAMSASDDPEARVEMAEAGAAGYMVKNVHMGDFLHTLDEAGHAAMAAGPDGVAAPHPPTT
jgi:DNA-binding NarL/FixJ family response regulator